jgi:hypothetical protein
MLNLFIISYFAPVLPLPYKQKLSKNLYTLSGVFAFTEHTQIISMKKLSNWQVNYRKQLGKALPIRATFC